MSKKPKVQINYRSGNSVVFECDDFKMTHKNGEMTSFEGDHMNPRPLFLGMEYVESVWVL